MNDTEAHSSPVKENEPLFTISALEESLNSLNFEIRNCSASQNTDLDGSPPSNSLGHNRPLLDRVQTIPDPEPPLSSGLTTRRISPFSLENYPICFHLRSRDIPILTSQSQGLGKKTQTIKKGKGRGRPSHLSTTQHRALQDLADGKHKSVIGALREVRALVRVAH